MKKHDFKSMAVFCMALACLLNTSSLFGNEEQENTLANHVPGLDAADEAILLAGGNCGGKGPGGGGCHSRTNNGNNNYAPDNGNGTMTPDGTGPVVPGTPDSTAPIGQGHGCGKLVNNDSGLIEEARRASLI